MDFKELVDERRRVRELCAKHVSSIAAFKFERGVSFKLDLGEDETLDDKLHHLTSTATCIESLEDCHQTFWAGQDLVRFNVDSSKNESDSIRDHTVKHLTEGFTEGALARDAWTSEQSAPIYCKCRILPLLLRTSINLNIRYETEIFDIFSQLNDASRFGIGEQIQDDIQYKNQEESDTLHKWYPENAYHTYWSLKTLDTFNKRFEFSQCDKFDISSTQSQLKYWIRAKLTEEIALHWAQSPVLDSDQLTWALAAFLEFGDDLSSDLRGQDLVRKAFDALALTQQPVGTWRNYRLLFVYKTAGNAYCYIFESFTFLLKAILKRFDEQEFLEVVTRGFIDRLKGLRKYAEITQVQNPKHPECIAWSSGHRPASSMAEGWATASVFSFLQAYRRVLGILARQDALRMLPGPIFSKSGRAIDVLRERGNTWRLDSEQTTVAEQLITLFVNPVLSKGRGNFAEPDDQPIEKLQARSAILFGPPGASKTTLVRQVAEAVGWKYVELHSSHFVAEGIQEVQRTADRIFSQLMELDHAVVLFDEPDELVREREGTVDAFGRFLTTSMLPKLAELWNQRKIIYFVATNHIRYFDAAIIRSERFDVLMCVSPPAFEVKKERLLEAAQSRCRRSVRMNVDQETIVTELKDACKKFNAHNVKINSATIPDEHMLAKFVLLRYDQIEELSENICKINIDKQDIIIDEDCLRESLRRIRDHRLERLSTYLDYWDDAARGGRDYQRLPVYSVKLSSCAAAEAPAELLRNDNGLWFRPKNGTLPEMIGGLRVAKSNEPGVVLLVD